MLTVEGKMISTTRADMLWRKRVKVAQREKHSCKAYKAKGAKIPK